MGNMIADIANLGEVGSEITNHGDTVFGRVDNMLDAFPDAWAIVPAYIYRLYPVQVLHCSHRRSG